MLCLCFGRCDLLWLCSCCVMADSRFYSVSGDLSILPRRDGKKGKNKLVYCNKMHVAFENG